MSYDLRFSLEENAENVLNNMQSTIITFGFATVADLKDFVGFNSTDLDKSFGWNDLSNVKVEKTADEYQIPFPEIKEIRPIKE